MTAFYTRQINFFGARLLHKTNVRWLGTYIRDQIPLLENDKRPFAIVINMNEAAGSGEHGLALYFLKGLAKIRCLIRLAYILIITYSINLSFMFVAVAFRPWTPRSAGIMHCYFIIWDHAVIHLIIASSIFKKSLLTPQLPANCLTITFSTISCTLYRTKLNI